LISRSRYFSGYWLDEAERKAVSKKLGSMPRAFTWMGSTFTLDSIDLNNKFIWKKGEFGDLLDGPGTFRASQEYYRRQQAEFMYQISPIVQTVLIAAGAAVFYGGAYALRAVPGIYSFVGRAAGPLIADTTGAINTGKSVACRQGQIAKGGRISKPKYQPRLP
jgi:hypothetical protein